MITKHCILSSLFGLLFINGCICINCVEGDSNDCACTGIGSTCVCSGTNPSRNGMPCISRIVTADNSVMDSVSLFFKITED